MFFLHHDTKNQPQRPAESLFCQKFYVWGVFVPAILIIYSVFLRIISFRNFTFGDDIKILENFDPNSSLVFPVFYGARSFWPALGRFWPMYFQEYNILAIIPGKSLHDLAHYCFCVNAVVWLIFSCSLVYLLTKLIRNSEKNVNPIVYLLIPLSFIFFMAAKMFLSSFLQLVFAEKMLCLLFTAFILLYYHAVRNDNMIFYLGALAAAVLAIYYKENSFCFFLIFSLTWIIFGRKEVTKKHWITLAVLLANVVIFLLLYYFIAYRKTIHLYTENRMQGALFQNILTVLKYHPIFIAGFLWSAWRAVRIVFYKDRLHLFFDALLFSSMGIVVSYFMLKLFDSWYFPPAVVVLYIILFYWLIVYNKTWLDLAVLITVIANVYLFNPMSEYKVIMRKQDTDLKMINRLNEMADQHKNGFYVLPNVSEAYAYIGQSLAAVCYTFLRKHHPERTWTTVLPVVDDINKVIDKADFFVLHKNLSMLPEYQKVLLQMRQFLFRENDKRNIDFLLFIASRPITPPASLKLDSDQISLQDFGGFEPQADGCWMLGKTAKIRFRLQKCDRPLKMTIEGFPFFYKKFNRNTITCFLNHNEIGKVLIDPRSSSFSFILPVNKMRDGLNEIEFRAAEVHSAMELVGNSDARQMVYFFKRISFQ